MDHLIQQCHFRIAELSNVHTDSIRLLPRIPASKSCSKTESMILRDKVGPLLMQSLSSRDTPNGDKWTAARTYSPCEEQASEI